METLYTWTFFNEEREHILITPEQFWTALLAVASAVVLLSNAAAKVADIVNAIKKPNADQNKRLDDHEQRISTAEEDIKKIRTEIKTEVNGLNTRFDSLDSSVRIMTKALLAMLEDIDGNTVEHRQKAKEELQDHLINK